MWPFGRAESPGQRGERLACRHLRRRGYAVLARNYRCPAGEIDIIALHRPPPPGAGFLARCLRRRRGPEILVFVEVKCRSGERHAAAESAVDARKRRHIVQAARYYLSHHSAEGLEVRFDVVAVIAGEGAAPVIRHTPGAFEAQGRRGAPG